MDDTALFLGAGFSHASGLKTTDQVGEAFLELGPTRATPDSRLQQHISAVLREFWIEVFSWSPGQRPPSLEDHFTLLDLSANTGHNLGSYTPRQLRGIRRLSIHRIFDSLDEGFVPSTGAVGLIGKALRGKRNSIITTNWDTAAERYILSAGRDYKYGLTTYRLDGSRAHTTGIPVLKLHGSSNWMYCDSCRRIFVGSPGGGKAALHSWTFLKADDLRSLKPSWAGPIPAGRIAFSCQFCGTELGARVATFSFSKALNFFQFQAVWDAALDALRTARQWVFVGYSLPQADFEIRRLLKTAQLADAAVASKSIYTVTGPDLAHQANYHRFFGRSVRVFKSYLDTWWKRQRTI